MKRTILLALIVLSGCTEPLTAKQAAAVVAVCEEQGLQVKFNQQFVSCTGQDKK